MGAPSETKKPSSDVEESQDKESSTNHSDKNAPRGLSNKVVIISAMAVVLTVAVATGIIVAILSNKDEPRPAPTGGIGYSTDAQVILSQEELQAALNQAMENARLGNIALLYKNNAYSGDGINFECYIVNSAANRYDMFLTIFADIEMTDQLFLSQLIRPGSGFNRIKLEHELEKGDHTVYVALTQVDRDPETGEEFILRQVFHTMEFHVI